jgi:hypothetical protein
MLSPESIPGNNPKIESILAELSHLGSPDGLRVLNNLKSDASEISILENPTYVADRISKLKEQIENGKQELASMYASTYGELSPQDVEELIKRFGEK